MKQFKSQGLFSLLSYLTIASIVLAGCGSTPTPPPLVLGTLPVSSPNPNQKYLNIMVDSAEFFGGVGGDPDGTGELQMLMVVSDEYGHADALVCPYGTVIEVHQGDKVRPCKAGLSYPEDLMGDRLYVELIAVDIDDTSALTDIGVSALTGGLSFGLGKAILAITTLPETGPVVIGLLALDAIVGYAGGKVQDYFKKSDVIGSQSFIIQRSGNWNNGQPINARSTNNQVEFTFTVQESSVAAGELVNSVPGEPDLLATPDDSNPVSGPTATLSGLPRLYDFSACDTPCIGTNGQTDFNENVEHIYLTWKFENIPTGAHYVRRLAHENLGTWALIDCTWSGPASGTVNIKVDNNSLGFTSGNWYLTIEVNGQTLLRERIFIEGHYKSWNPPGTLTTCDSPE